MKQSKGILKSYFETGDRPTQTQFEDLIDSFVHEDDITRIYVTGVERVEATGDSVIRLSNGSKLVIQNPTNVINQDNKIKVVDLGNVRLEFSDHEEVSTRRLKIESQETLLTEKTSRLVLPVGDTVFPKNSVESILASVVNRLNPPITIEEDEIVIFQYNIIQQSQT